MSASTPSRIALDEIVSRLSQLHDPDADLIILIRACAASGRWAELRSHMHDVLLARGRLAHAITALADALLTEPTEPGTRH